MVIKKNNISNFSCTLYRFKSLMIFVILVLSYNSVIGQEKVIQETVNIPEPLMFDLVRGLGAKQGELEINSLADLVCAIDKISTEEQKQFDKSKVYDVIFLLATGKKLPRVECNFDEQSLEKHRAN